MNARSLLWGMGLLVVAVGCGGAVDTIEEPPAGSVSDRQRRVDTPPAPPSDDGAGAATCSAADECTEVFTGDVCACDCNAVVAMHVSDARAYAESHPRPRCDSQCGPCAARGVTCDAGRCALAR